MYIISCNATLKIFNKWIKQNLYKYVYINNNNDYMYAAVDILYLSVKALQRLSVKHPSLFRVKDFGETLMFHL